jgi:hypothetical protein
MVMPNIKYLFAADGSRYLDISKTERLCPVEYDGKRRSDKQQHITLYPGKACMGCDSCYARNTAGGLGTPPKLYPEKKAIIPGKELINTSIDAFLSPDVALVLEGIDNPLNLFTKFPHVALESLRKYPLIWQNLDYHIQVTTIKDGEIMDLPALPELVKEAKSISCRVDPTIPGMTKDDDVIRHLRYLKGIGVSHVSSKAMRIYPWQSYPQNVMRFYSDNVFVTRSRKVRMVNEDEELRTFRILRKATDELGMTLGVCMSRPSSQELATGPCEGGVYIGKYGEFIELL